MGLGCSFAGCGGDTSRLGLAASRRKRCLAIVAVAFLILLAGQGMSLFQKVHKFFLVLYDVLSEFKLNVSRDIGDVNIYLWTRKEKIKYKTLEIGDSVGLAISNFNRQDFNIHFTNKLCVGSSRVTHLHLIPVRSF